MFLGALTYLDTILPQNLRMSTRENAIFMVYVDKIYHFYEAYELPLKKLPLTRRT